MAKTSATRKRSVPATPGNFLEDEPVARSSSKRSRREPPSASETPSSSQDLPLGPLDSFIPTSIWQEPSTQESPLDAPLSLTPSSAAAPPHDMLQNPPTSLTTTNAIDAMLGAEKHWIARGWTGKQYLDMAKLCWEKFPLDEYCIKHKKSRKEVKEVFMGTVQTPLKSKAERRPGKARGGVGEERMKTFRVMKKAAKRGSEKEDKEDRTASEDEETRVEDEEPRLGDEKMILEDDETRPEDEETRPEEQKTRLEDESVQQTSLSGDTGEQPVRGPRNAAEAYDHMQLAFENYTSSRNLYNFILAMAEGGQEMEEAEEGNS